MKKFEEEFKKKILDCTRYGGNKDKGSKSISASSLGNDDLQLYMRYKHGVLDNKVIGQNTLGSIFHLGMEAIYIDNYDYEVEYSMSRTLPNGWKVTGTADLIDTKNKIIIDYKLTKTYAITNNSGKNNKADNAYALQLGVLQYLMKTNIQEDYRVGIAMFDKQGGYDRYLKPIDSLVLIEPNTYNYSEIEELLLKRTNKLQEYIDNDVTPPECKDLWKRNVKGNIIRTRCKMYCDYDKVCPYNDTKSYQNKIVDMQNLI